MPFKQYQQYQKKFNRFKQYLEEQRKIPDVGAYQVEFTAIDPHIPNYEMAKQEEKHLIDPITKPEGHS